jgi:hypothetical protein
MSKNTVGADSDYQRVRAVCPTCGASVWMDLPNMEEVKITWEEAKRRFRVSLSFVARCPTGHNQWEATAVLKDIPLVVAETSRCSCGATLVLGDHTLRRSGALLELEAEYVCESCQHSERTVLRSIGHALRSLWKTTRKIQIGATGVSYEKSDGQ